MFGADPDSAESAWMLPEMGATTTTTGGAQRLPLLSAVVNGIDDNAAAAEGGDDIEVVKVDADFKGVNGVRFTA